MTDPFDALREPVAPVDPDPAFAAQLRDRLARAVLGRPLGQSGAEMTQTTAQVSNQTAEREPAWGPALVPYIVVTDARRALTWYVDVLGGELRGEPHVNDDGTIGHAEVGLGDAVLMLAEASDLWPDVPVHAPEGSLHSHTLHLQVDDVDATTERARRAGAAVEREPADQPYGRGSVIVDPFGHRWMLLRPPGRATRYRQGDVANVSIVTPDADRSKAFYEAVLRMPFSPGRAGSWNTEVTTPRLGVWSPEGVEPGVELTFRVDDIAAAVERVRSAGGRSSDPDRQHYGLTAECTDDQGTRFRLWQPVD
jgi:uncharacterized glyoxalase superfamily protein PhnB